MYRTDETLRYQCKPTKGLGFRDRSPIWLRYRSEPSAVDLEETTREEDESTKGLGLGISFSHIPAISASCLDDVVSQETDHADQVAVELNR